MNLLKMNLGGYLLIQEKKRMRKKNFTKEN